MPRQATYLAAHWVPGRATHPPDAIGTRGPLGDQITSIEASFDFSVQRSLKYPHVRAQMGNFATASRLESDPSPPVRSRGVQRDPLGPLSQNRAWTSGWELESQIWGPPPSLFPYASQAPLIPGLRGPTWKIYLLEILALNLL